MATFTTVIHVVTCVLIVLVVLMQSGKGAEISSNLGGSSQTIFGNSGGNFFTKLTFSLAAVFMVTSLILTLMGSQSKKSVFEGQVTPSAQTAPVGNPVTDAAATGTAAATTAEKAAPATTNTSPNKAAATEKRGATKAPENSAPGSAGEAKTEKATQ